MFENSKCHENINLWTWKLYHWFLFHWRTVDQIIKFSHSKLSKIWFYYYPVSTECDSLWASKRMFWRCFSLANWILNPLIWFYIPFIVYSAGSQSSLDHELQLSGNQKKTIDRSSSTSSSLFCAISVEERSAKLLKGQNATRRSKGGRVVRPVQVNEVFIHFQYLRRRTCTRLLSLSCSYSSEITHSPLCEAQF